jgi:hypothetical protein
MRKTRTAADRLRPPSGQALIAVLVLIVIGAGALIYRIASPFSLEVERDRITHAALAQAKDALIGRAASDQNRPGSLPCPDLDNNGSAELFAGTHCPGYIGRLPWRTLGLPDLRDGSGERLWYALSRSFRDHNSAQPINSDTAGELTVTGTAPATGVIAIVFAPGPAVGSQVRDTANENAVANYLEGGNEASGTTTFTSGHASGSFNDKLLAITGGALLPVVEMRVAREVRQALIRYYERTGVFPSANRYSDNSYECHPTTYDGRIPLAIIAGCSVPPADFPEWAADELPDWFALNNWNQVVHYAVSGWCASTNPSDISLCASSGGLTVTGMTTTARALVIAAGRGLGVQSRPCGAASDCLEDAENTNGNTVYVPPARSDSNNDRLLIVSEAP